MVVVVVVVGVIRFVLLLMLWLEMAQAPPSESRFGSDASTLGKTE